MVGRAEAVGKKITAQVMAGQGDAAIASEFCCNVYIGVVKEWVRAKARAASRLRDWRALFDK